MQDSVRDAFMVGEKMLGYSMNTTDKAELEKVKEKLIEAKAARAGLCNRSGKR